MSELFTIPETLSPRLKWIKKHGVQTHYCDSEDDWVAIISPEGEESKPVGELFAEYGESLPQAYSDTEDDAIRKLAQVYGILLWNEEPTISRHQWMRDKGLTTKQFHTDENQEFWTATAHDPLGKHIITVEMPDEESALIKIAELLKIKDWRQL